MRLMQLQLKCSWRNHDSTKCWLWATWIEDQPVESQNVRKQSRPKIIRKLTCWTHMAPILCPASTHSSKLLPATQAPMNPPANASPAPLVSTIWSSVNAWTGWIFGDSGSVPLTTTVDSAPWVITTIRGREVLDLGNIAMALATAGRSVGLAWPLAVAQASASDSLAMTISVCDKTWPSCWPKNWGMKGAESLRAKTWVSIG